MYWIIIRLQTIYIQIQSHLKSMNMFLYIFVSSHIVGEGKANQ